MNYSSFKRLLTAACMLSFGAPALAGSFGTRTDSGQYVQYDVPGAVDTEGKAINKHGTIAGIWGDSSNLSHGFVRAADGTITTFDPIALHSIPLL